MYFFCWRLLCGKACWGNRAGTHRYRLQSRFCCRGARRKRCVTARPSLLSAHCTHTFLTFDVGSCMLLVTSLPVDNLSDSHDAASGRYCERRRPVISSFVDHFIRRTGNIFKHILLINIPSGASPPAVFRQYISYGKIKRHSCLLLSAGVLQRPEHRFTFDCIAVI